MEIHPIFGAGLQCAAFGRFLPLSALPITGPSGRTFPQEPISSTLVPDFRRTSRVIEKFCRCLFEPLSSAVQDVGPVSEAQGTPFRFWPSAIFSIFLSPCPLSHECETGPCCKSSAPLVAAARSPIFFCSVY